MNKEIFGNAGKLFLRLILINVMCFFVAISFSVLATAAFTEKTGYDVYDAKATDSKNTESLYTYSYGDGEDTKEAEYIEKGYTLNKVTKYSKMTMTENVIFYTVTQIFCILILIIFIYPNLWDLGTKDSNLVKFKHKSEDKYKGVKIGLLAVVPSYLGLVLLCVMKGGLLPDFSPTLYRTLHSAFFSLIAMITGASRTIADVAWWRMALLFLLPLLIPVISGISYYLGYKNFSIGEKLVYKKNKE